MKTFKDTVIENLHREYLSLWKSKLQIKLLDKFNIVK